MGIFLAMEISPVSHDALIKPVSVRMDLLSHLFIRQRPDTAGQDFMILNNASIGDICKSRK